jgi:hypothetical protein
MIVRLAKEHDFTGFLALAAQVGCLSRRSGRPGVVGVLDLTGLASVVLAVEHGREPLAVLRDCEQRDAVWRERDCGVADCHSDGGA